MYIHRQLEKHITPFLQRREVISVVGPRQAGKTTFVMFLADELRAKEKLVKSITLEKRADLELFQNNIEDFKKLISKYEYVIIDEFQYAKDGGRALKYLYDTTNIKFIISGSSSLELTFQFQTGKYMVGRLLEFTLWPFSFREFLSAKEKDLSNLLQSHINQEFLFNFDPRKSFGKEINRRLSVLLGEYVMHGGFPAVVLSRNAQEKQKLLEGIVDTYLLKDIKGLLHLAKHEEILKLSKALAAQIGAMIRYEELGNIAHLTYKEVHKHLAILENTFIISLIKPFFINKRTELTKNPKVYFMDLGMRNSLLSDFRTPEGRNDIGSLMENHAFNLLKQLQLKTRGQIRYWRTKSKAEVDFIVEYEQNIYPIEIKYTSRNVIGKSLYSFIEKFNPKQAIILTKDYAGKEQVKNTAIMFIPLSYL